LDFVKRSETYDTCVIQSEFTIARNSALVSVHTVIDNNVNDHRLVLHLPTGVKSDRYQVNQCNLILSRPIGLDNNRYTWKEHDITEQQFESMAFLRSEEETLPHGLMFLSKGGLHEVSCPGDRENSIDITLLRCFNKTVNTDGEPDGELQGKQEFDYAILPISEETDCSLVRIKDQYVCGYMEFTIPSGAMLISESAFTFTSNECAYITSMPAKKSSGIIIRAVNYSAEASSLSLHFTRDVTDASLCNFLEEETGSAKVDNNDVSVTVPPYKMVNIKITFA
jgi:alpha-mannosidase